ncbi:MAG: response regulator [Pseudomonadota bacterium]
MRAREKSKKELIAEIETLLLRIEELEVVERKYHALTGKIQHLADHVLLQNTGEPAIPDRRGDSRATILVVDDNDTFRKFMQEALGNEGYTVYAAESSAEALRLLKNIAETVGLMIADIVMPEGSGSELYKHVKAAYPHIKVLFISGYTDEILIHTDVQEVIESKVAFLQKPFSVSELIGKVKRELGAT